MKVRMAMIRSRASVKISPQRSLNQPRENAMTTLASRYAFPPAVMPGLAIVDSTALFPVRRVFCVGRNYAAHAREMGADPSREPPFFFCKPSDGVVPVAMNSVTDIAYPPQTSNLHHEVEMVVAIGQAGANIPLDRALDHVFGYALGLDLTRRDLQNALKSKGHPWEMGKAFDQSAPVSAISPVSLVGHLSQGTIQLDVNGELRQQGELADMIWSVAETIGQLSQSLRLAPGDLIFTGTPEGVGPVVRGDVVNARLSPLTPLQVRFV